jgi:16S rRNA processing protein RimM
MIKKDEIFPIGQVGKPHGIKGELSFTFTTDVFDTQHCKYFILEREKIYVPFFISEYRFKGANSGFVKFEDIDTEEDARELSGASIYLPKRYMDEAASSNVTDTHYFVGFEVVENAAGSLGKIVDVNDDTANILFELADGTLIPLSEEYITGIDHKKRILFMNLPEGLLDL